MLGRRSFPSSAIHPAENKAAAEREAIKEEEEEEEVATGLAGSKSSLKTNSNVSQKHQCILKKEGGGRIGQQQQQQQQQPQPQPQQQQQQQHHQVCLDPLLLPVVAVARKQETKKKKRAKASEGRIKALRKREKQATEGGGIKRESGDENGNSNDGIDDAAVVGAATLPASRAKSGEDKKGFLKGMKKVGSSKRGKTNNYSLASLYYIVSNWAADWKVFLSL